MADSLAVGLSSILNIQCLSLLFVGVTFGIIFGCMPGLTTNMALAVALPISFTLANSYQAFSLLVGVYMGGCSGGCIAAILINIPGTPGSVATTFDGHPMAAKGEGGRAIGIAVLSSFIGSVLGFIALITISKPLATFGLKFGNYEYFALGIFALTIISSVVKGSIIKGLGAAAIGMALSMIGQAPVDSVVRFTFGVSGLRNGLRMLTLVVGFYAMGALLDTAENGVKATKQQVTAYKLKGFGLSLRELKEQAWNMLRSALIGIGIGILPGMGGNISNLVAYSVAKSNSKYPEKFGTGIADGIVATETANNATIGGAFIPLLTLGIPGDNATALLMGAFMTFGLAPGPLLFAQDMDVVYSIYFLLLFSAISMVIIIMPAMPIFVKLLDIPRNLLLPSLIVLCTVGVYGSSHVMIDLWVCLVFGIFAYFLRKLEIPIAPIVIAFVLTPTIEKNFRRGLMMAPKGNFLYFFTSPIVCVLFAITAIVVVAVTVKQIKDYRKSRKNI